MMPYKKAISIEEQIQLYRQRGLVIEDNERVRYWLHHVGYYRLSVYAKYFQNSNNHFKKDIQFLDIISLYFLDSTLRIHLLTLLERIESSVKATLIEYMTSIGGAECIYQATFLSDMFGENSESIEEFREKILDSNKKHLSIKHFFAKGVHVPIRSFLQVCTLGEVSFLIKNMTKASRRQYCSVYGLKEKIFMSYFEGFRTIRNICAHHDRMRNAIIRDVKLKDNPLQSILKNQSSLGSYIQCMIYFVTCMHMKKKYINSWLKRLQAILQECPDIEDMGIHNSRRNDTYSIFEQTKRPTRK